MQPELARQKDPNLLKAGASPFRHLPLSSTLFKFLVYGNAYLTYHERHEPYYGD